ncbi:MAG: helix-turn-helix domain-containing protein [Spirochaetaceae bacterium]|jgi:AraC-like DNA-binding protein/ligand-binding sensor protein|nr:helix-turn-helix domain-containing protein [Spirochaetaceae bacterium]
MQLNCSASYVDSALQTKGKHPSASRTSRREIEPLLLKAEEMLKSYESATNTMVSILDKTGQPVGGIQYDRMLPLCAVCKQYRVKPNHAANCEEYPCTRMHINGIGTAQKTGGVYIYMCEIGFMFWTSPLFSNGRSLGALIAGGILGVEKEKAVENIRAMSNGNVPREGAEKLLAGVREHSREKIKALSQVLLLCAEQASRGSESYNETVVRRAEQKSYFSKQIHLLKNKYAHPKGTRKYPLDKERVLLAALRRGDSETGGKILNELLEILHVSNPDNFQSIQFRAMELVVLLSRAAVMPDHSEAENILEINDRCLRRIQDARNAEELTAILHLIVERMSARIFSFQGVRHASALRKAERFIWENYTRKISLKEIADASGLSAPYFSTVFKEEMGENLSSYLNRIRIEKAAAMLVESESSLSDIAGACGFEDQSWFSKIFKSYMGVSPGKFRDRGEGTSIYFSLNSIRKKGITRDKETG